MKKKERVHVVTQNSRSKKEKTCKCFLPYHLTFQWLQVHYTFHVLNPSNQKVIGKFSSFLHSNCIIQLPCLPHETPTIFWSFPKKFPPDRTQNIQQLEKCDVQVCLSSYSANSFANAAAADKHLLQVPCQLLLPLSETAAAVDEPLRLLLLAQGDRCQEKRHGQPALGQTSHADLEVEGYRMSQLANWTFLCQVQQPKQLNLHSAMNKNTIKIQNQQISICLLRS